MDSKKKQVNGGPFEAKGAKRSDEELKKILKGKDNIVNEKQESKTCPNRKSKIPLCTPRFLKEDTEKVTMKTGSHSGMVFKPKLIHKPVQPFNFVESKAGNKEIKKRTSRSSDQAFQDERNNGCTADASSHHEENSTKKGQWSPSALVQEDNRYLMSMCQNTEKSFSPMCDAHKGIVFKPSPQKVIGKKFEIDAKPSPMRRTKTEPPKKNSAISQKLSPKIVDGSKVKPIRRQVSLKERVRPILKSEKLNLEKPGISNAKPAKPIVKSGRVNPEKSEVPHVKPIQNSDRRGKAVLKKETKKDEKLTLKLEAEKPGAAGCSTLSSVTNAVLKDAPVEFKKFTGHSGLYLKSKTANKTISKAFKLGTKPKG